MRPTNAPDHNLTSFLDAVRCLQATASYLHSPRQLCSLTYGPNSFMFTAHVGRSRKFCTPSCLSKPNRACQCCFCATSRQVDGCMSVPVLMCSMAKDHLLVVIGGNQVREPNEAKHLKSRSSPNVAETQLLSHKSVQEWRMVSIERLHIEAQYLTDSLTSVPIYLEGATSDVRVTFT